MWFWPTLHINIELTRVWWYLFFRFCAEGVVRFLVPMRVFMLAASKVIIELRASQERVLTVNCF
jgi:hypothetical protein